MCGICGFASVQERKEKNDLIRMASAMARRGPDAEGYFLNSFVGFAHRRLTIIDVSNASNQPFYSACGNYVIVFNGEIYNYQELYSKLSIIPRTTGDTEIILELFVQYGPSFVTMLNGMFAFVIADLRQDKIYLFRDRLGIKPLFYALEKDFFVFASEIKSVLEYDKKKLSDIDMESVSDFLHLGFVPQPNTIYKKIKKFPSGHYAVLTREMEWELHQYWNIQDKILPKPLNDEKTAKDELKSLLISSVRYRMISDVPLGTFLSGGIDSSLVTAIAQSLSDKPINTFSIGFKESNYNESGYAKKIALHLGTHHRELIVSEQDALDHLLECMDVFDEPFTDVSALPVHLVSKLASGHVKVVLSGDGGDELFHGYGMYQWAERLNRPMIRLLKKVFHYLIRLHPDNLYKSKAGMFDFPDNNQESHIFSQEQMFFTLKEIERHFNFAKRGRSYELNYSFVDRVLTPSEKQALFDIAFYLKDDLMVKVDRMTMYNSIEGREPLLDYRLVEFAANLDPLLKVRNNTTKYLLKEVLYDYLPAEYFARPKWGFSIPLASWLSNKLHFLIEEHLSEEKIRTVGLADPAYVKEIVHRFEKGQTYYYNKIWQLIIIHRFLLNRI
jgi:asparagine synthase (glutamine-hydrolysing)